jgi:CRISPR system Cascade subunit CasB
MDNEAAQETIDSIILRWWIELDHGRRQFKKKGIFRTKDSATLRRAKTTEDVVINCEAYHILLKRVTQIAEQTNERRDRLAVVAAVIAHVRVNSNENVAQYLKGLRKKSDSIELRFKRLLQEYEPDELMQSMIRAVKLVGNEASVVHLAASIMNWTDPKTKKQWAYDFY